MMYRLECTPEDLQRWHEAPHSIARTDVVLRVEGPGAVTCLQGIFTNDIERAGTGAFHWGAVLTPKGMIITDLWLWRRETDVLAVVPEAGAGPLLELLRKSFPPRLAKVIDVRQDTGVWWLTKEGASELTGFEVSSPQGPAPFHALAIGPREVAASALSAAGYQAAPAVAADVLALLAGWPVLGREMDGRTLVQEVRFDELQGVRYDKGCYVGQETVSRLHFRGHPNRTLRAIVGRGAAPASSEVTGAKREVGSVATLLQCGGQWVASAKLRREVGDGEVVQVAAHDAVVHPFPIAIETMT